MAVASKGGFFALAIKRWAYNVSGFNKYGLHHDDCLDDDNEDVAEAVRRLPQNLQDERVFRIVRALQLDTTKTFLPKDQWIKYEEDNKYLQPYLQEVIKERRERDAWDIK